MNVESLNPERKIILITTGGTIEKTYDEFDGSLGNRESIINDKIISRLRLPYTKLESYSVLSKDSLEMTDKDRDFLATSICHHLDKKLPIVVLHGTDTMQHSAEYLYDKLGEENIEAPIIFTGAMRPLGFIDSDARQNVTEAIFAAKLVKPGIYISFHNGLFHVPGVRKNRAKRTFERYTTD